MSLQYALFDLDETLYARNTMVLPAIDDRIVIFLADMLGLSLEQADTKRLSYNEKYGTVIRGLLQEETVDIEAYLDYVHDIEIAQYLSPSPELATVLNSIPLKKFVFTNSYRKHAESVINALGIAHCFEGIFDIQSVNYVSKPARHPYTTVLNLLGTVPDTCVFIDDKLINMKEPKIIGMRTILIDAEPNEWVDVSIDNILEVNSAIQSLLDKGDEG